MSTEGGTVSEIRIITRSEALTPTPLPTDVVPVGDKGHVRVRALTREEARSLNDLPARDKEAHMLAIGITEPQLSVSDIKAWQVDSPAGELQEATVRIGELSGMLEDSAKAAYKSDGDGPDAGV